jgi:hypothetical protein
MRLPRSVIVVVAGGLAVAAAIAVMFTVATPRAIPVPRAPTDAELETLVIAASEQYWTAIAERDPGITRPSVRVVSFVPSDLWAKKMVACLASYGITGVVAEAGGGLLFTTPRTRAGQFALDRADYGCQVAYPTTSLRDRIVAKLNARYLYEYYVTFLRPCLALHGYFRQVPPQFDEFSVELLSSPVPICPSFPPELDIASALR